MKGKNNIILAFAPWIVFSAGLTSFLNAAIIAFILNMVIARKDLLRGVKYFRDKNIDARVFAKLVMRDIRYAMLISFAPELIERIKNELASGEFEFVASMGKHAGAKRFPNVLREFLAAYSELGRSHIPTLPLELAVVRLLPDDVSTI